MPSKSKALRRMRRVMVVAVAAVLGLALLLVADLEINQWLLRWRAERLMAEMHQIRLYQSTWTDAQRLMHEWGAWGHYEGSCTAEDCHYQIVLTTSVWNDGDDNRNWLQELWQFWGRLAKAGARPSDLYVSFTVHKGTIWRESAWMNLYVVPEMKDWFKSAAGYSLIVRARSTDSLHNSNRIDQLAEHPWYRVGRPNGCMSCLMADVVYSTHTPPREIERLTTFDFSCLTRWRKCEWLGDLLPAAHEWNLYGTPDEKGFGKRGTLPPAPRECDIPLWALGRDATSVHAVQVLSRETVYHFDLVYREPEEKDAAVVLETLKGAPFKAGQRVNVWPLTFGGEEVVEIGNRMEVAEHMEAGKRYLVIDTFVPDEHRPPDMSLDRCGVHPDTPEVRRELKLGFQMNDELR